MAQNKGLSGFQFIFGIYLVVLVITLIVGFSWAVPAYKETQLAACDMGQSALSQIGPQQQAVPPQTAAQCKIVVESEGSGLFRGAMAVVFSMVVSAFITFGLILLLMMLPLGKK